MLYVSDFPFPCCTPSFSLIPSWSPLPSNEKTTAPVTCLRVRPDRKISRESEARWRSWRPHFHLFRCRETRPNSRFTLFPFPCCMFLISHSYVVLLPSHSSQDGRRSHPMKRRQHLSPACACVQIGKFLGSPRHVEEVDVPNSIFLGVEMKICGFIGCQFFAMHDVCMEEESGLEKHMTISGAYYSEK